MACTKKCIGSTSGPGWVQLSQNTLGSSLGPVLGPIHPYVVGILVPKCEFGHVDRQFGTQAWVWACGWAFWHPGRHFWHGRTLGRHFAKNISTVDTRQWGQRVTETYRIHTNSAPVYYFPVRHFGGSSNRIFSRGSFIGEGLVIWMIYFFKWGNVKKWPSIKIVSYKL